MKHAEHSVIEQVLPVPTQGIPLRSVFRRKGVHDRFSLSNDQFSIEDSRIRIANLG